VSPASELAEVRADLLLADLAVVEAALQKAEKKARGKPGPDIAALRVAKDALDAETPLRSAGLSPEDATVLRGFAALTQKPEVVIANLEEGSSVPDELGDAVGVYAAIEAEVAEMEPAEARALLEEFGVDEPGLESVIAACYRALDLITFLTTGDDETRAWEVRHGATAPEAAGAIHTDLQRGFIRAEVIGYDELVAAGSMDAAKAAGKVRVEGKDYLVQEGDILHVRFAV
jgi:ribosome-binding ATPase YchF (GTP1/OBG family)